MTIKAADDATVVISVLDGSDTPTGVSGYRNTTNHADAGGVYINAEM